MSSYQKSLISVFAAVAALSCVHAPFPRQMLLQHIPTIFVLIVFPLVSRRHPISDTAATCLFLFMLFHVLGARYIYSYVPYDAWAGRFTGRSITAMFGFRRNHYDRVVHFMFGLLWVRIIAEVVERHFHVPRRFALYSAVEFVLAFSMMYELFEWGLTMVLSPNDAGAYNGQQGDIWDAHKDMSCAVIGSILGATFIGLQRVRHASRR